MYGEQLEKRVSCPSCGERQTVLLDLSIPAQAYVEDCQVCCRPMVISYAASDDELLELDVRPES